MDKLRINRIGLSSLGIAIIDEIAINGRDASSTHNLYAPLREDR